jgi:transposase-like protein
VTGSRIKGKIANTEWPSIVERYLNGETIANIARSYDCTAPAIRYIVRRSAAFSPMDQPAVSQMPARAAKVEKQRVPHSPPPPVAPAAPSSPAQGRTAASSQPTLNRELVLRANSDVAAFLVALDAAHTRLDAETVEDLRDAADRLLHACARTRLELERLTATPARVQS